MFTFYSYVQNLCVFFIAMYTIYVYFVIAMYNIYVYLL